MRKEENGETLSPVPESAVSAGQGRCAICGREVTFEVEEGISLREALCPVCGGSARSRDLARTVLETLCPGTGSLAEGGGCLEGFSIYHAQASGAVHRYLSTLPHYVCSEYLDGVASGSMDERGVRCEDIERLTFPDDSFDLVITQDVFEHVKHPWRGFMEVRRVLKPGGVHIFTVPLHEGRDTIRRVTRDGERDIFHLPPVYHGDPLREGGSLVYTDFGDDITRRLQSLGFPTEIAIHVPFYSPDTIPYICDGETYEHYLSSRERGEILKFLRYNSVVFVSRKGETGGPEWTGERYLPWVEGEGLHYEHLHRYRFAKEFVRGKHVLDMACGEGYGSFILSEDAESVVGVDISPACVRHASTKYGGERLRFVQGSITDVPLEEGGAYDVVVCFEALEHIEAHDALMDEVTRVLKPNGVFIVSTPDKDTYSDRPGYHNPFHARELYLDEFRELLSKSFGHVFLYGQRVEPGSRIFPLFECHVPEREFAIEGAGEGFVFTSPVDLTAKYYIAVASDDPDLAVHLVGDSRLVDLSDTVIRRMGRYIGELGEALQQKESVMEEQRRRIHDQEERIQEKNDRIHGIETELDRIKRSRAWRIMRFLRHLLRRGV